MRSCFKTMALLCGLLLAYTLAQAQNKNLRVQSAQGGERRIALVIGNDSYQSVSRLENARSDARAIARSLEQAGFAVTLRLDVGERAMKEVIRNFKNQVNGGDVAVFYYSGHGVQLGAANYLLPTDIRGDNEDQVKDEGVPLQRILDDLQDQKAKFSLAIIDACRDNPFKGAGRRAIGGRGLAPTTAATGQMVLFSAGAGQQALDKVGPNDRSSNGLFTRVLLAEMNKPGLPVDRVLRNVREQVVATARSVGHEQVPALYDQSLGDFYFRPGEGGATSAPQTASTQIAMGSGPSASSAARPAPSGPVDPAEAALWKEIENSKSREDFESYLKTYSNGRYVPQANDRIQQMDDAIVAERKRVEDVAWAAAERAGTVAGYERYLGTYARGSYATLAEVRVRKLKPEEERIFAEKISKMQRFKDCTDCPEMMEIPTGSFQMGDKSFFTQLPVHTVTISKPFALGTTEVTQSQWQAVMGSNPSKFKNCGLDCPVESVSWNDAQEFIRKLNAKTGKNYRLPSEAEWEYACRAGGQHEYCGSDDVNSVAWYDANSGSSAHPVKGKEPNAFGLYDMSGNVSEWVQDNYHNNYRGAPSDGSAWEEVGGERNLRVLRGGSGLSHRTYTSAAKRGTNNPGYRDSEFGFRLARTLQ